MNTTLAATTAGVSVPTVRTWARTGVITAIKQAGRWIIDETSLRYRIALAALKTHTPAPKPIVYSVDTMTAIGGNRWTKAGKDRIYLEWANFAGLELSYYGTGNISGASYQGVSISNSQGYKLLSSIYKVYFDVADGKLHCQYGHGESRIADRKQVWNDIITGVRAAIAAL